MFNNINMDEEKFIKKYKISVYRVLGIDPNNIDKKKLKNAYKSKSLIFHPDKNNDINDLRNDINELVTKPKPSKK